MLRQLKPTSSHKQRELTQLFLISRLVATRHPRDASAGGPNQKHDQTTGSGIEVLCRQGPSPPQQHGAGELQRRE